MFCNKEGSIGNFFTLILFYLQTVSLTAKTQNAAKPQSAKEVSFAQQWLDPLIFCCNASLRPPRPHFSKKWGLLLKKAHCRDTPKILHLTKGKRRILQYTSSCTIYLIPHVGNVYPVIPTKARNAIDCISRIPVTKLMALKVAKLILDVLHIFLFFAKNCRNEKSVWVFSLESSNFWPYCCHLWKSLLEFSLVVLECFQSFF